MATNPTANSKDKSKNEELEYLEPLPALEVTQGEFTFYVFQISAKKLLSIAYTSERTQNNRTGIQRGLRKDRLKEIGAYLKGESGPPILPNTIIVSLSSESKYKDGALYIRKRDTGEAFILDGQHRLWAFDEKWCGDSDLNLVVSAFINLEDKYKALIFKKINGEQKKINPSLVYDLIPMMREENWVKFEDQRAQDIVEELNTLENSPWRDRIGMIGGSDRIISQASFITAIKKLLKSKRLFASDGDFDGEFFEAAIQVDLLLLFSNLLSTNFDLAWDNKKFFLCKYVGVSATFNLLELVLKRLKNEGVVLTDESGLVITQETLEPYIIKLKEFDFSTESAKSQGKSYSSEAGISELTKTLSSLVFP